MRLALIVSLLLAAGTYAEDYEYVASTEIAVAERIAFFNSLEAAGFESLPRAELISTIEKMEPGHSFLLECDVIFDGAYRTVQFAIQKTIDRSVDISILTHGKKFSDQVQSVLKSIQQDSAG